MREAVPAGVNQRIGAAKRPSTHGSKKRPGDMIVPFDRFGRDDGGLPPGSSRGLDYAIWGHISDGNVHPNVIPRSFDDVVKGQEAILEFGPRRRPARRLSARRAWRRPKSRQAGAASPALWRRWLDQMRAVKRRSDPVERLAPGNLSTTTRSVAARVSARLPRQVIVMADANASNIHRRAHERTLMLLLCAPLEPRYQRPRGFAVAALGAALLRRHDIGCRRTRTTNAIELRSRSEWPILDSNRDWRRRNSARRR